MNEVTVRTNGDEFLTLCLWGHSHPDAEDYWDGNWLYAGIEVKAGGFSGSVGGQVRAEELVAFGEQLKQLQETLRGTAEFKTMEDWLSIRVEGDGRGHMNFRCVILDERGGRATLHCTLATDQTFTRSTLAELAAAVEAFPVRGTPR
jgi:hypothetical protein